MLRSGALSLAEKAPFLERAHPIDYLLNSKDLIWEPVSLPWLIVHANINIVIINFKSIIK
jgi:hypothetical protein